MVAIVARFTTWRLSSVSGRLSDGTRAAANTSASDDRRPPAGAFLHERIEGDHAYAERHADRRDAPADEPRPTTPSVLPPQLEGLWVALSQCPARMGIQRRDALRARDQRQQCSATASAFDPNAARIDDFAVGAPRRCRWCRCRSRGFGSRAMPSMRPSRRGCLRTISATGWWRSHPHQRVLVGRLARVDELEVMQQRHRLRGEVGTRDDNRFRVALTGSSPSLSIARGAEAGHQPGRRARLARMSSMRLVSSRPSSPRAAAGAAAFSRSTTTTPSASPTTRSPGRTAMLRR